MTQKRKNQNHEMSLFTRNDHEQVLSHLILSKMVFMKKLPKIDFEFTISPVYPPIVYDPYIMNA